MLLQANLRRLELRDNDKADTLEKVLQKAVENINTSINEVISGMDASDIYAIDKAMIKADGTKDKSNFGANAILDCFHCMLPCSSSFS